MKVYFSTFVEMSQDQVSQAVGTHTPYPSRASYIAFWKVRQGRKLYNRRFPVRFLFCFM